nr:unnamed protein product [Digitaria exilis]
MGPGRNLLERFCPRGLVVPWTTFPTPASHDPNPPRRGGIQFQPRPPSRAEPRRPQNRARSLEEIQKGLEAAGKRRRKRAPVVARSSASVAAAAGVSAMITRSKLVEQLRDYQIRSQHK